MSCLTLVESGPVKSVKRSEGPRPIGLLSTRSSLEVELALALVFVIHVRFALALNLVLDMAIVIIVAIATESVGEADGMATVYSFVRSSPLPIDPDQQLEDQFNANLPYLSLVRHVVHSDAGIVVCYKWTNFMNELRAGPGLNPRVVPKRVHGIPAWGAVLCSLVPSNVWDLLSLELQNPALAPAGVFAIFLAGITEKGIDSLTPN